MRIEVTETPDPSVRRLLREHEDDMARRYPDGTWDGTAGRKDVVWVARTSEDEAIGIVALRVLAAEVVEVKHLYVVESARRSGVARALMAALEAEAHRRHATIVLETGTAQPEALALYRALGYQPGERYEGCDSHDACSVYLTLDRR